MKGSSYIISGFNSKLKYISIIFLNKNLILTVYLLIKIPKICKILKHYFEYLSSAETQKNIRIIVKPIH